MKNILLPLIIMVSSLISAQVKIGDNVGTINANSILELESTNKGVLFPRVSLTGTTDATTVGTQVAGMTVYNTATTSDVSPGMYTNSGSAWVRLGSSTPAYQNIGGGVQTFTTNGTISDTTYFVLFTGSSASTLIPPTAVAGKTITVRTTSTGTVSVAGSTVGTSKGRTFVSDGTTWYMLTP